MSAEPRKKPRVDPAEVASILRRVLRENARDYTGHYVMAVACLMLVALSTAFTAWIMRDVIDKIFYEQRLDLIYLISGGILAAFVVRGLAGYAQAVLLSKIGNNLVARYQKRLFDHIMRLGIDFFAEARSGRLAARINENVIGVRDLLNMTITSLARDLLTLLALIGVMIYQKPMLTLFTLLIGPPLIYTVNRLMRRLRRVTRESVEVNSRLIGAMQETIQGIGIVKAFTMEDQLSRKLGELIDSSESRANKIARVSERTTPIAEILAGVAVASVLAYAGFRSATVAEPPGEIVAFITALLLAYDPARRLARVQVHLERALVNARMIYEILDIEPRQRDSDGAVDIAVRQGEIRFEDVRFGYAPDQPVLRGVSFLAAAGRTTAIVGTSGTGKTTIIGLIQRFYDLWDGRIVIDGQDIAHVTKQSLRRSIAYVSQQPYLFEGTIRDNIRYGRPDATDAEIEAAAVQAQADGFIRGFPAGYDTVVGENGMTFSGGQRQRISIARAIVRNAPILLLDEATSALDNESEAKVQQALETVMKGRTTIVVAHRLSTVTSADHIVVLAEGQVAEQGMHAELLARPGGLYARFHQMQDAKGLDLVADDAMPGAEPVTERAAT